MWLCRKWHGAWLYGVHRTRRDGSSFMWHQPCQRCKYTTSVDIQKRAIESCWLMQNHTRAQWIRLRAENSDQQQQYSLIMEEREQVTSSLARTQRHSLPHTILNDTAMLCQNRSNLAIYTTWSRSTLSDKMSIGTTTWSRRLMFQPCRRISVAADPA